MATSDPLRGYSLEYNDRAVADLARLDRTLARRIAAKLGHLAEQADMVQHAALSGELHGIFRQRIGDWRALYLVDHEERRIVVVMIGHRRDVYKG